MASIKLNASMRETIRDRLLTHKYKDEIKQMIKDFRDLAEKSYNHVYPQAMRDRMEGLPEGWLPEREELSVQFGDASDGFTNLPYNGMWSIYAELSKYGPKGDDRPDRVVRRAPAADARRAVKVIPFEHSCAARFFELKQDYQMLKQSIQDTRIKVMASLNAVTTVGALVRDWPEVYPFAKDFLDISNGVPALPTQQLNAMLGLPVEEKAA